jgi:hypothetical protein
MLSSKEQAHGLCRDAIIPSREWLRHQFRRYDRLGDKMIELLEHKLTEDEFVALIRPFVVERPL